MVGIILFLANIFGGKITVVATDGNDVEPVEVDRLIIAVSKKPMMSLLQFLKIKVMNFWLLLKIELIPHHCG